MIAFKAENVSKQYTNHTALDDVSLTVPQQSIFGLLGPNGAGKTTFIRIVNQIISSDSGRLWFKGEKLKSHHIARIGYLPEERGLYKKMKVGEQALYLAMLKGIDKTTAKKRLTEWFDKFEMKPWWNKKVEDLSKGMQQKVQFVVTVLHQPELLIFDEPFSGFDPINVNLLKKEILRLRDEGATIIFSTHNMASVEELCDHIVLIDNSKKILEGDINAIRQQFKTGLYEVITVWKDLPVEQNLPEGFRLVSAKEHNRHVISRVKVPANTSPNLLLEHMIRNFEIIAFNEILPGMDEIFIEAVGKNKMNKERAWS